MINSNINIYTYRLQKGFENWKSYGLQYEWHGLIYISTDKEMKPSMAYRDQLKLKLIDHMKISKQCKFNADTIEVSLKFTHWFVAVMVTTTYACFVAIVVAIFDFYCHLLSSSLRRQNNILVHSSNTCSTNKFVYIVCIL